MRCYDCEHYQTKYMWNGCDIIGGECFMPMDDCGLVNDDGSINYDDKYFKEE